MIFNYLSPTHSSTINTTQPSIVSEFENKIISGFDSHPEMQLKCLRFAVSNISYCSPRALISMMMLCLISSVLDNSGSVQFLYNVIFSQQKTTSVSFSIYFYFQSRTIFQILFQALLIYIFVFLVFCVSLAHFIYQSQMSCL